MKIVKAAANLVLTGALSACAWLPETPLTPKTSSAPIKTSEIYLQEPFTRVVAKCQAVHRRRSVSPRNILSAKVSALPRRIF